MSLEEEQVPALPKTLQWAVVWLLVLCALFVVNALAALVGLHVFALTLPLCVILSTVGFYWLGRLEERPVPKRRLVGIGAAFLVAVVLFGMVVSWIWEYSEWGRGFYTEAVVQLANGWNPIYDDVGSVSDLVYRSGKSLWYVDASLYAFLGHYEMAKAHTLLFAVPTFLLTQYGFRRLLGGKHRKLATVAALLSLVNPVALSQMFSFYGDAVVAYCIQCFLILAYLILNEGYLHSDLLMVLAFLWLFLLHSQSGGICAAMVLGIGFFVMVAVLYKKRAVRWLAIRAGIVVFCGFVIIGFNPFIQNLVDTGNPFALTFGSHAVDLVTPYMPVALEGKTWFGRFLYSMMASPDTNSLNLLGLLQQFTALFNSAYAQPDVRLRGFGFLGGILLIAAVVLLVLAIVAPRSRKVGENAIYMDEEDEEELQQEEPEDYIGRRTAFLWMALPILVIALFTSTIWWARTVAILWFLIPLAVVALSTRHADGKSRVGKMLLMLAFLNCALMAVSIFPAAKLESNAIKSYWERMTMSTDLPSDEDAQLHNQFVTQYKVWNDLKKNGEEKREQHAIWTKIEGIVK